MNIIYILLFLAVCGGGYAYWHQRSRDPEAARTEEKLQETRKKFEHFMSNLCSLPEGVPGKKRIPEFRKSANDIESKLKNKKTDARSAISSYNEIIAEITKITNHKNNQAQI